MGEITKSPSESSTSGLPLHEHGRGVYASIDPLAPDSKTRVYNATRAADFPLGSMIGEVIEIQDVVIHPVTSTDPETGEVSEWIRTVLIAPDGTRFDCGSVGVLGCIRDYARISGNPPWVPAWRVRIKQVNRGAHRLFQLEGVS